MRLGITKTWPVEWFAKDKKQSAEFFVEDVRVRDFVEAEFPRMGIAKITIRKTASDGEIVIYTAKLGVLAGKDGSKLKQFEDKLAKTFKRPFKVTLKEVKNPELSAKIMVEFISTQLEARMPYRKVAKQSIMKVMEAGAEGVKIQIGGRLGGADISRAEKFSKGRVSLQTLRTDIDYFYAQAMTKYGVLGVKVWISQGDVYEKKGVRPTDEAMPAERADRSEIKKDFAKKIAS